MLRMPIGVQESVGNPPQQEPVLPGAWKYFSVKNEAASLLNAINQAFGLSLALVDDTEENVVFTFSSDSEQSPRVWSIVGNDAAGNFIYENAGWILDRKGAFINGVFKVAYSAVDKGQPFGSTDTLKMNFATMYGIAQFYWSK